MLPHLLLLQVAGGLPAGGPDQAGRDQPLQVVHLQGRLTHLHAPHLPRPALPRQAAGDPARLLLPPVLPRPHLQVCSTSGKVPLPGEGLLPRPELLPGLVHLLLLLPRPHGLLLQHVLACAAAHVLPPREHVLSRGEVAGGPVHGVLLQAGQGGL